MILQALVGYYEALAQKGKIARPGWAKVKVSYALEIDQNGQLLQVYPLESEKGDVRTLVLPAPVKRTVGIDANLLCDNSAYMLGFAGKGNPERSKLCFEAAKNLHLSLLSKLDDPYAKAICGFFETWNVSSARDNPLLSGFIEDIEKGTNLVFMYKTTFPSESCAVASAWQEYYDGGDTDGETMRCLVTGNQVVPAPIHPAIKGVQGAQSSGAALVSFNAQAYCSYNREQNLNAPVGKYAAFAYTTALNHLLSDKKHVKRMGDTTLVYWAENAEPVYQDVFSNFLDGGDAENKMTDEDMDYYIDAISNGKQVNWDGIPLIPDNRFFVLGLSPNAARLSVRFFLRDGFGSFVKHIREHYENIEIVSDNRRKFKSIPLWALLRETVNEKSSDKSASPQMSGDTLRAILTGSHYPETLYRQTIIRIMATHDDKDKNIYKITQGKAAIIKAYLIRNRKIKLMEELMMNEDSVAYNLGRLFCVLEDIQRVASPALNSTIKDRYFNSASTTPFASFPTLLRLKNNHIKVVSREKPGLAGYFENTIAIITAKLGNAFPRHLTMEEQGMFVLGYYHQRNERKSTEKTEEFAGDIKEEK